MTIASGADRLLAVFEAEIQRLVGTPAFPTPDELDAWSRLHMPEWVSLGHVLDAFTDRKPLDVLAPDRAPAIARLVDALAIEGLMVLAEYEYRNGGADRG